MNTLKPAYKPETITKFLDKNEFYCLVKKNNFLASLYLFYHICFLFVLGFGFVLCIKNQSYILSVLVYVLFCSVFNFLGTTGAMHEFAHGTVFTNKRLNKFFFHLLGILTWTNATLFRATHLNHHKNFLDDDDVEGHLGNNRKLSFVEIFGKVFISPSLFVRRIYYVCLSIFGIIENRALAKVIDDHSRKNVRIDALSITIFHSVIISSSFFSDSFFPIVFLTLPTFCGQYIPFVFANSQHNVGISNMDSYSQLTASVSLKLPVLLRALYWNMNFHSEHHLAPAVPHYNLSRLQLILLEDSRAHRQLNLQSWSSEIRGNYVKN